MICAQEPLSPPWTGKVPAHETHPCLYFSAADLPGLRDRITREPFKSWWATLLRQGTEADQAMRWLVTGDETQAEKARRQLVDKPIHREPPYQYIEPSSHSFLYAVVGYDMLASWPGLSAADHKIIRDKLAAEAEHYYTAMEKSTGGQHYGNQRTLGASALGACALVLADYQGSTHTPQEWLDRALWAIRCPENFWFWRPDGMFVEGYGYSNYMGMTLMPFMVAYSRLSGQNLFEDPTLRAWLRYQVYNLLPGGQNTNFGTSNYGGTSGILFPLVTNRAFTGKSADLYAWGARQVYGQRLSGNLIYPALGVFDDTITPAAETYPASMEFSDSQQMVMKDGWSADLTGVWITGKGTGWAVNHHGTYSHEDVGSFIFYSAGKFLAIDSGYPHWHGQDCYWSDFHNLVLIDGKGPKQDTLAELTNTLTNKVADVTTVDTRYEGHRVQRLFLFAEKRVLFVADLLQGPGQHEYAFQLHSPVTVGKATAKLTDRSVTWPGFDPFTDTVSPTTLTTTFAGPVTLMQVPSHWRPSDDNPVDNIAIQARWRNERDLPGTLLTALVPQQPQQPVVKVTTQTQGLVQSLRAETSEWVVTAQLVPGLGRLRDGNIIADTRFLAVSRDARSKEIRWIYVCDNVQTKLKGLPKEMETLPRALLVHDRNGWHASW